MNRLSSLASLALLLPVALFGTGCYGASPPPVTQMPTPERFPGAQADVDTRQETHMEQVNKEARTCDSSGQNCVVTKYQVSEPVVYTYSSMQYAHKPVSYADFMLITDTKREEHLAKLDENRNACERANIPRWIGIGMVAAGVIATGAAYFTREPALTYAGLGSMGGGGVSYGVGYFAFGGQKCNEAAAQHRELEVADKKDVMEVSGSDTAADLRRRALEFNANPVAETGSPKPEAPKEVVAAAPPPPARLEGTVDGKAFRAEAATAVSDAKGRVTVTLFDHAVSCEQAKTATGTRVVLQPTSWQTGETKTTSARTAPAANASVNAKSAPAAKAFKVNVTFGDAPATGHDGDLTLVSDDAQSTLRGRTVVHACQR